MAVIYDTAILRPDVGVHQLFPPAGATRGLRVPTINGIAAPPAAPPVRRSLLEARWTVADDGRLACAWVRTSRA